MRSCDNYSTPVIRVPGDPDVVNMRLTHAGAVDSTNSARVRISSMVRQPQ